MALELSVVIATYDRQPLLERLLAQLGAQTLEPARYEVVVVDDGSKTPVAEALRPAHQICAVRVLTQQNAGAAAARHRGILAARGGLLVLLDDDMQVPPGFLAAHLAAHPGGSHRAVLGRIKADPAIGQMPLFERWYAHRLDVISARLDSGAQRLNGSALYSGNVSLQRGDYLAVGGFDPALERSEDAELGLRLEAHGVELAFCPAACSLHGSDHASEAGWLRRAFLYGVFDSRIRTRHPAQVNADPWRFFFKIRAAARPLLAAAALAPDASRPVSRAVLGLGHLVDRLGLPRAAYASSAVAYSMEYFRGVRAEAGSLSSTVDALARHVGLRRRDRRASRP
jgi:glycosyltransferase involved in cell wall biosynthesis